MCRKEFYTNSDRDLSVTILHYYFNYFPSVHMDYQHSPPRKKNSKCNLFPCRTVRWAAQGIPSTNPYTTPAHATSLFSPWTPGSHFITCHLHSHQGNVGTPFPYQRGIWVLYIYPLVTPFVHLPRKISDHQCFSKLGIAQTPLVLIKV